MPAASGPGVSLIRFGGEFELDPRAFQLRRSGETLKLERIPLEILLFLAEQPGLLVSREQIAERIWGKDVNLDIDNSINGAIRKIRQILRDDPEQPRFIQTVTGRGYRFIAPLTEAADQQKRIESAPVRREGTRTNTAWLAWAGLFILLLALGAGAWWWSRSRTPSTVGRVMLAVLPFQNLTGDPAQEYLSDGLTEEMISQLGNRDPLHLGVIARTSVMHYKNNQRPLNEVERDLGVQYVLTGSVRRDANQVRVAAQLIQAQDQAPIWSRQYDRKVEGFLALQREIAQEIADEIQMKLGGTRSGAATSPAGSTPHFAAYDLYLRGQFELNKRSVQNLDAAVRYFDQATALDSTFAQAYAARADAYALLPGYSGRLPQPIMTKARESALRALQLDPSLAEAHTALALIVQNYDWDWGTAEREYRRAIELDPNYATAHHWYAEHLMWLGRFDEALRESERARQLDPLSLIIAADNGAILFYSRQYDRAIAKWRSVLDLDPEFPRARLILYAYVVKGMSEAARTELERWHMDHTQTAYWANVAGIEAMSGRSFQARAAIQQMLQCYRRKPVNGETLAAAYAAVGDTQHALTWLERSYQQRDNALVSLGVNPVYDILRGEPRFQRLLRLVGLLDRSGPPSEN